MSWYTESGWDTGVEWNIGVQKVLIVVLIIALLSAEYSVHIILLISKTTINH